MADVRKRVLACCGSVLVVAACSGTGAGPVVTEDDAITVASFSFVESGIVAEIYALALEDAGFRVERLPEVGTRELVMPALQRGLIEVVPEYAGSALSFLGGEPTADEVSTHAQLRAALDSPGDRRAGSRRRPEPQRRGGLPGHRGRPVAAAHQ